MKMFIRFERKDGSYAYINPDKIVSVEESGVEGITHIDFGTKKGDYVKGTIDEVVSKIERRLLNG